MKNIGLLLGTITFGQQTDLDQVREMLHLAEQYHMDEIDSAYVYNEGKCEKLLGQALGEMPDNKFRIATKVNPRITGRLDREAIYMQQNESLRRLGISRSDVMYLHFPDPFTRLEDTLSACNELHLEGKFNELGLSNYPASKITRIQDICRKNGWIVPTVFEGVYNAISRKAEGELFETLHRYGMRFTAYNPLAGGLLTGKYRSYDDFPAEGRFAERASYQKRYWKEDYFEAVSIVQAACDEAGIPMAEAALRWLAFHSELKAENNDGVIIGSSRPSQLESNLISIRKGDLPSSITDAYDSAWEICRESAPEYYRVAGK